MTWVRRAYYVLPVLIAGLTMLVLLGLDAAGAYCTGKDSGNYHCNTAGNAQWVVLLSGLLLTATSAIVWGVTMLALLARRLRKRSA